MQIIYNFSKKLSQYIDFFCGSRDGGIEPSKVIGWGINVHVPPLSALGFVPSYTIGKPHLKGIVIRRIVDLFYQFFLASYLRIVLCNMTKQGLLQRIIGFWSIGFQRSITNISPLAINSKSSYSLAQK